MMDLPASRWRLAQLAAALFSLLLHLTAGWLLLPRISSALSPSAPTVMMVEFAPEIQIALIPDAPPGINQQRRVEESMQEATEQTVTRPQDLPQAVSQDLPAVAAAKTGELTLAQKQPRSQASKKPAQQKRTRRPQAAVAGNSTVTSRASPAVQQVVSDRNAAPVDSDASQSQHSLLTWEARVKAKINRVKMYPEDASRRGRTGSALISFTVNAEGRITASSLQRGSGTLSLDRAALAAVRNAQPLPAPPPELLRGGLHKVTLPVRFDLTRQ